MPRTSTNDNLDVHIGQKLKFRRLVQGKTLSEIGSAIGVSFQQIQKYETGKNTISSRKLYALSQLLGVDTNYFFEQLSAVSVAANELSDLEQEVNVSEKEIVQLIKSYSSLKDARVRKQILDLVCSLSKTA